MGMVREPGHRGWAAADAVAVTGPTGRLSWAAAAAAAEAGTGPAGYMSRAVAADAAGAAAATAPAALESGPVGVVVGIVTARTQADQSLLVGRTCQGLGVVGRHSHDRLYG